MMREEERNIMLTSASSYPSTRLTEDKSSIESDETLGRLPIIVYMRRGLYTEKEGPVHRSVATVYFDRDSAYTVG